MGKFLKQGKVVVLLRGRFAGRKAVIVKTFDDAAQTNKKFSHCLVAGIDRYPKKVTRKMSEKKITKRLKVRPFVKLVNYNHLMPTRYVTDFEIKKLDIPATKGADGETTEPVQLTLDENVCADPAKRQSAKKAIKKVFEQGLREQDKRKNKKAEEGVQYFYQKLRF